MEAKEMGRIWSMHYPKHHSKPDSHQICTLICSLIRAEASMNLVNCKAIIAGMLAEAGIPIDEFEDCESGKIN